MRDLHQYNVGNAVSACQQPIKVRDAESGQENEEESEGKGAFVDSVSELQ